MGYEHRSVLSADDGGFGFCNQMLHLGYDIDLNKNSRFFYSSFQWNEKIPRRAAGGCVQVRVNERNAPQFEFLMCEIKHVVGQLFHAFSFSCFILNQSRIQI